MWIFRNIVNVCPDKLSSPVRDLPGPTEMSHYRKSKTVIPNVIDKAKDEQC